MDTADDFKEMTGAGLDVDDAVGIIEIDEEVVIDDDIDPLKSSSLSGEDAEEGEEDDMMAYLFSDEELNAR